MPVASKVVECNADEYVQLTTASTGFAFVYNPDIASRIPRRLGVVIATTKPQPTTPARLVLNADEAIQRTTEMDNHFWGKLVNGSPLEVVVIE